MSVSPRPMREARRMPSPAPGRQSASRAACEVLAPSPALTGVTVAWRVLRRAVGGAAPSGGARMLVLRVGVHGLGDAARASVSIVDPDSGRSAEPIAPAEVAAEVIPDIRGEIHIEAPGWLHATIAPKPEGGWRLVYARTPVLSALNIPGGRAEVVGVEAR